MHLPTIGAPAIDAATLFALIAGASIAGVTSGFSGFGTALVASAFWFHALPAAMVPPLVVLSSTAAQSIGFFAIKDRFDWPRVAPLVLGGLAGIPLGVFALGIASPGLLRFCVGALLLVYAAAHLSGLTRHSIGNWGGRRADGAVGALSGFLGGFAGLSGILPIVWLQLRGGAVKQQRGIYQPFNFIVLSVVALVMLASGKFNRDLWQAALVCLPFTIIGAWAGVRLYRIVSEVIFRNVILCLLTVSGLSLIVQTALLYLA